MPIRAAVVDVDPTFASQLAALKEKYPDIAAEVEDLKEFLVLGYDINEIRVDPESTSPVYVIRLDYRPLKSAGRGLFRIIYHATPPTPSMTQSYRRYTLLRISERAPVNETQ